MPQNRETRRLTQNKQNTVEFKKGKPLASQGDNGDITIRQLDDGVFLFFKALGKWYKTLNAQSQIIPETPNARSLGAPDRPMRKMYVSSKSLHIGDTKREQAKISLSSDSAELEFTDRDGKLRNMIGRETGTAGETDENNDFVTKIGKDNVGNAQGWLALGSGASHLGGVIQGAVNLANTAESGYLGLRVLAQAPTNKKQFSLGASMIAPFTAHMVGIGCFNKTGDASIGGFIDIAECALDPPTAPPAGSITLYAKADGLYVYQDSAVKNLSAMLPLAGGTITGDTTLTNNTKIIFGDAGEYITGDGTDLTIASSGDITLDADGGDVTIQDTGTAKPRLVLKNTAEQYGSPPVISFEVTPSNYGSGTDTGASGDDIGRLDFKSNDDAGNETTYVKILSEISVATDGQEGGKLSLQVASHDAEMNNGLIIEDGSEEDEVDVTIGNGDNSATIIKGKLSFGSNPTTVSSILDEDNMATDSNSALATQQSVKAYVDSNRRWSIETGGYR